jgi:hypothetical protein
MRLISVPILGAALAITASAQINEGFESLPDGPLVGQGAPNWSIWYSGGADGTVISTNAHGGSKSLSLQPGTDVVRQPVINSGSWTCSVWTFVPSTSAGDGFFIMLNQYGDAATDNWSVTIRLNAVDGVVESWFDLATLPIITDRWVELRVEINLDDDRYSQFYDGVALTQDLVWTQNVSGNGLPQIRCIDVYSSTTDGMLWDDLVLEESGGCPCSFDSDGSGSIDLADLATLLSLFGGSSTDPCIADTDGDGVIGLSELAQLLALFGSPC